MKRVDITIWSTYCKQNITSVTLNTFKILQNKKMLGIYMYIEIIPHL